MSNRIKQEGEKGRMFWRIIFFVYLVLFISSYLLKGNGTHSELFGYQWDYGLSLFLAVVLYTIASIQILGPQERGGRILLGWFIDELRPGPVFIPFGICKLKKASGLNIQSELPSDPENIFREKGAVPEGKFPPIRIPFGPATTENGCAEDDPLNRRMTQEVVPVVTWRILNFRKFFTTMGDEDEAKRQMEDASIVMLMEEFTKITPAVALKNLPEYNQKLKDSIRQRVGNQDSPDWWGIKLIKAEIKTINFSHELNTSIQSISEESAKKKATIIKARATKEKSKLEGEGSGLAEEAILKSRTVGLKYMSEELDVGGQAVLGAETARGITNNPGQKTIIAGSGGFSDIATTGAVIGEVLKENKKEVSANATN